MQEPQRSGGDTILEVDGLTKVFAWRGHSHVAVDGVSFALHAGGSLAVVGESGSGKTTIARIIAGLETATSGTVVSMAGRSRQRRATYPLAVVSGGETVVADRSATGSCRWCSRTPSVRWIRGSASVRAE